MMRQRFWQRRQGNRSTWLILVGMVLLGSQWGAAQTAPEPAMRNSIGMEFVLIPAGSFQMGTEKGEADERPAHQVTISRPFYLGKYEVTQAQWQALMGNNPSLYREDPKRPVEQISWDDAQAFVKALNAKEGGAKYRLPTEAEWEYAAQAGSTATYSFGDDATQLGQYAWHKDNAGHHPHPVGQLQPNAWGLYDMHGNVWEWVQDWYGPYKAGAVKDPQGPDVGTHRMRRGCAWNNEASICRTANRYSVVGFRDDFLGFRVVREVSR